MAAVAAPVMGPVSEVVAGTLGSSILVEVGLQIGTSGTTTLANYLVISKPIGKLIPVHSKTLETTGLKVLLITLKYKRIGLEDAALGFYRSSVHQFVILPFGGTYTADAEDFRDTSLFATVKDYLAIEKGWFSPYLFASGRRPAIPRSMKPDIVFCHGPFLEGDSHVASHN